jgi:hypothetical protein
MSENWDIFGKICPVVVKNTQTGDEGIIDFNAQIPDGALDLGMSQQQLHGT